MKKKDIYLNVSTHFTRIFDHRLNLIKAHIKEFLRQI